MRRHVAAGEGRQQAGGPLTEERHVDRQHAIAGLGKVERMTHRARAVLSARRGAMEQNDSRNAPAAQVRELEEAREYASPERALKTEMFVDHALGHGGVDDLHRERKTAVVSEERA